MPITPPYFYYPFAEDGDVLPLPITTQPSGVVSYQNGYGTDYELDLLTNPDALPIGRTTMNQLFLDITTLLQQYSQYGVPLFITTAQNQGVPFPYPIYARVNYAGLVYENQVPANTVLPGLDNTWLVISAGGASGVSTGTVLDYAGFAAPSGYLSTDGSAVDRTTYGALLAVITQTQSGTTTNTLATVTGLTSTAQMYAGMEIESANFPASTTILSVDNATDVTMSNPATAGGVVPIQFFNWGSGDGLTTFNIPDLRRDVTVGQGGSASSILGNVVGQKGGEELHTMTVAELATHDHPQDPLTWTSNPGTNTFVGGGPPTTIFGGVTEPTGSSTPFNVMQPSTVMYKIIKT
jgi:Phage Tail Collar Domain